MLTLLSVFFLVFLALLAPFLLFGALKRPFYRVDAVNVAALFDLLLNQQATESDWQVFIGIPIRHDEQLESMRSQCADLDEAGEVWPDSRSIMQLSEHARRQIELAKMRLVE